MWHSWHRAGVAAIARRQGIVVRGATRQRPLEEHTRCREISREGSGLSDHDRAGMRARLAEEWVYAQSDRAHRFLVQIDGEPAAYDDGQLGGGTTTSRHDGPPHLGERQRTLGQGDGALRLRRSSGHLRGRPQEADPGTEPYGREPIDAADVAMGMRRSWLQFETGAVRRDKVMDPYAPQRRGGQA